MDDEKNKFLDTFTKLEPIHQAEVLAHANLILHIQESTKKRMIERLFNSPEYADCRPAPMGVSAEVSA
jgi:hypothetical protein